MPCPEQDEAAVAAVLAAAVDGCCCAVFVLDAAGGVHRVNAAARELCRATEPEIRRRGVVDCVAGPGACRDAVARCVAQACAGEDLEGEDLDLRGEDAAFRRMRVRSRSATSADGRRFIALAFEDLAPRQRLEDDLLQAGRLSALGQLIAGVAHELNNPLTGVLGFTQLALQDSRLAPNVRMQLETVRTEAARAARIVETMLDFSRRRAAERRPVRPSELLERTFELQRGAAARAGVLMRIRCDVGLPRVHGHVTQLQQVLLHLTNNALDALSRDRRGGTVTIQARREGDGVLLVVEDDGHGLAPDAIGHLFQPFFTTKEGSEGPGLGLSLSWSIVQAHGGRLEATNRPEGGARFSLWLPAAAGEAPATDADVAGEAGCGAVSVRRNRVLVVDDEDSIRHLCHDALEQQYEVHTADRGHAALTMLRDGDYDAVVTDVRMPGGMSGLDLYREATRLRPNLSRRFLFITGHARATQGAPEGLVWLDKPFTLDDLRTRVQELIAVEPPAVPSFRE